jgi:hypothetical protein
MRIYTDRTDPPLGWYPGVRHAIGETLRLDFTAGDFDDADIPDFSRQNWEYYDAITFWMALDNFRRENDDKTKVTRRQTEYLIRLRDSGGNIISRSLDTGRYPESWWGTVKYHHIPGGGLPEEYTNEIRDLTAGEKAAGEAYSRWKRVKISLNNPSDANFDFSNVERFDIRYSNLTVSWTVTVGKPDARVAWFGASNIFKYINEDGSSWDIDKKDQEGDLNDRSAASDGYYYLYNEPSDLSIRWIEDPNSTDIRMREDVLMPTLRIDRIEVPGKPATQLNYGLPHCLRLEVTNWKELPES